MINIMHGHVMKKRSTTIRINELLHAFIVALRGAAGCGHRWLSRLSERLPPLRSWFRALYRRSDRAWEEFVKTLLNVVGFLRVLRFPPTGEVDMVG